MNCFLKLNLNIQNSDTSGVPAILYFVHIISINLTFDLLVAYFSVIVYITKVILVYLLLVKHISLGIWFLMKIFFHILFLNMVFYLNW